MRLNSLLSLALATGLMTTGCATRSEEGDQTGISSSSAPRATQPTDRTTDIPDGITTPDQVESPIGTLSFFDGVPTDETVAAVYENLDRMRAVEAFLSCLPGVSMFGLRDGPRSLGQHASHQVVIFDKLMSSESLFLTANTSTMYSFPFLDLKTDGPTVVEVPPGQLGAFNDMWFRYVGDLGPAGPDKGNGGKYLVLPPGYSGDVPDGYFVVKPRTYGVWVFMRGSIAQGLEAGAKVIEENLRIYPLAKKDDPPEMEFISGSAQTFNTVAPQRSQLL